MQVASGLHDLVCDKSKFLSHSLSSSSLFPQCGTIFSEGSRHTEMIGREPYLAWCAHFTLYNVLKHHTMLHKHAHRSGTAHLWDQQA